MQEFPLLQISHKEWQNLLDNKTLGIELRGGAKVFLQVTPELSTIDNPATHFNQCGMCGKEFSTQHGLEIHQTKMKHADKKKGAKNGR